MSIFHNLSQQDFQEACLASFRTSWRENSVYREYCDILGIKTEKVKCIEDIPFLPIQFFKSKRIIRGKITNATCFESSGTTSKTEVSKHYVTDLSIYNESLLKGFQYFFGDPQNYIIKALLPSYLDRKNSSLVYMVNKLMEKSDRTENAFYNTDIDALLHDLTSRENDRPIILFGVTFALLQLVEKIKTHSEIQLPENITIIETGGMKGRDKERTRMEIHSIILQSIPNATIASEYGMTELLSQAYAVNGVKFSTPPWMRILIREINDPFSYQQIGKTGGINVIDLANINSCPFIATDDLGRCLEDGSIEIMGRFDNSDLRGCNLIWS